MSDLKHTYLYDLSEEGQAMLASEEVEFDAGGLRENGKQVKQVRPSPLNIDQVVSSFADKVSDILKTEHEENEDLVAGIEIERQKQQAEVASIVEEAFQQSNILLQEGINSINENIKGYFKSIVADIDARANSFHFEDIRSQADSYLEWLESDIDRITLPDYDYANGPVLDHIGSISNYLKHRFDELFTSRGAFAACSFLITQLLEPFTKVVIAFSFGFYNKYGRFPARMNNWLDLIKKLVGDGVLLDGYEYYLRLYNNMSYRWKVAEWSETKLKYMQYHDSAEKLLGVAERMSLVSNNSEIPK